jgi:hypothetical protein
MVLRADDDARGHAGGPFRDFWSRRLDALGTELARGRRERRTRSATATSTHTATRTPTTPSPSTTPTDTPTTQED